MTLKQLETRLQAANPKLSVRRYGTSMAAVFKEHEYVLRIPQGEITPYNVTEEVKDHASQYQTPLNPGGAYTWKRLKRRGRNEVARMLYTKKLIRQQDIARISK